MLNSSSSEFEFGLALALVRFDDLQHGADILLHGEPAKDRGFLRQIADPETGTLIHRQLGDVVAVEFDGAAIRLDQAGDHVEHRGLSGAVRTKQADGLAAPHIDADAAHDLTGAETLFHAMHSQEPGPAQQLRTGGAVGLGGLCRLGSRSRPVVTRRHVRLLRAAGAKSRNRRLARDRRRIPHGLARSASRSSSAVMSSCGRAKLGRPRLAGRRRNMPSRSTIPAPLSLSRRSRGPARPIDTHAQHARAIMIRPDWIGIMMRLPRSSIVFRSCSRETPLRSECKYRLIPAASTAATWAVAQVIDVISVCLNSAARVGEPPARHP